MRKKVNLILGSTAEGGDAGTVSLELHRETTNTGVQSESGLLLANGLSDTDKSGHLLVESFLYWN